MADLNIQPNALFTADNLYVLNGMNSACIDLIYLDPPFNSKRLYKAPVGSKAAGAAFEDMWSWKDVDSALMVRLSETHPFLVDYITAIERIHSKAMMAYIAYMAQRLFEMHRVLKPTGSIYLHCDPTAAHYLKVIMDRIFGAKNFRNEIVWKRRFETHNLAKKHFGRIQDRLLFYTSDEAKFKKAFLPYDEEYIGKNYKHEDARGKYATFPCTNETGGNTPYVFRGVERAWRFQKSRMEQMYRDNLLVQNKPGGPFRYKKYLKDTDGVPVQDIWADIPAVRGNEDTGYPTQKPLALLDRIIKASSNEGDVVFDPFCGCATTCVAAQRLRRRWIGIDLSPKTEEMIRERLADDVGALFNDFTHYSTLPGRNDVKGMAKMEAKPQLYGEQEGHCAGCKEHFEARHLEVDHIIPSSKGGGDFYANYQLLCGNCNRIKGNRPMEYLVKAIEARKAKRAVFGATPSSLREG